MVAVPRYRVQDNHVFFLGIKTNAVNLAPDVNLFPAGLQFSSHILGKQKTIKLLEDA